MWTKAFWKAAGERMVRGGAAAVFSAFFVGDKAMNALNVNWEDAGGLFVGGAIASLLFSLIGGATSGDQPASPALVAPETVKPAA